MKDVNKLWKKYQLIMFSPTIEAGIDFNVEHIDKIYVILSPKSTSPRGLMQMLGRCRNINDNNIMVYLNNMYYSEIGCFYQYYEIENYVKSIANEYIDKWKPVKYIDSDGNICYKYDYDLYLSSNKLVKLGELKEENNRKVIKMLTISKEVSDSPIIKKKLPSITKLKSIHKSSKTPESPPNLPKQKLKLGLLRNKSDSCYLDSLLMSIMHRKNDIFSNIIDSGLPYDGRLKVAKIAKQVKTELQIVYNHIQSNTNSMICSNLRNLFKQFDESYKDKLNKNLEEIDWISEQQEPLDVIVLFERMLKLSQNIKKRIIATDGDIIFDKSAFSILLDIDNDDPIDLKDHIPKYVENINNKTKTTIYESCKGMMIHIKRGYISDDHEHKKKNKIKYYETLQTENKNTIELVSIIVHHGSSVHSGHYTCLIKHDNEWYEFDDLKDDLTYIGEFKNISSYVSQNAVDFIYI